MTTTVTLTGGGTRVTVGGPIRRITLDNRTVAKINDNRMRTTVSGSGSTTVTSANTSVSVGGAMGVQGPTGAAGAVNGTIAPIAFSYGDAAGTIYMPSQSGTLTYVRVVITTPFNGLSPAVEIGVLADPDAAIGAAHIDPTEAGEYELTADLRLAASEALRITITPGGGGSAGAGLIYLNFVPD